MIEPYRIEVAPGVIDDLRARLDATRYPAGVTDSGGLPLGGLQRLVGHWRGAFDWDAQEARLNAVPHFIAVLGDVRLHFIHLRADRPGAPALLLLHGWPGSFVEFMGVIERLRGSFHLVVPSLPGFTLSPAPGPGMSNARMAEAMAALMSALGHERFGVHGGDVGSGVASWMAIRYPERLTGLHLNFIPGSYVPPAEPPPSVEERDFLVRRGKWTDASGAYAHLQRTRPLTPAYALSDSPAGLAAWIAEKFAEWTDPRSSVPDDVLLTNVTLYWVTNCIGPSMRLYLESAATPLRFGPGERITVPTGIAHFPHEISFPPRSWVERVYPVTRWTDLPRGGHFAALEEPELLAAEIAAFFGDVPDR